MKKLITLTTSIIIGIVVFFWFKPWKKSQKPHFDTPLKILPKTKSGQAPKSSPKTLLKSTSKTGIKTKFTSIKSPKINRRQMDIMDFLNKKGRVPMNNIEKRFPKVNVRTLRRDLERLQKVGLIEKKGSTKASTYKKL
jgi:predicted HTH transcriptional regulator